MTQHRNLKGPFSLSYCLCLLFKDQLTTCMWVCFCAHLLTYRWKEVASFSGLSPLLACGRISEGHGQLGSQDSRELAWTVLPVGHVHPSSISPGERLRTTGITESFLHFLLFCRLLILNTVFLINKTMRTKLCLNCQNE